MVVSRLHLVLCAVAICRLAAQAPDIDPTVTLTLDPAGWKPVPAAQELSNAAVAPSSGAAELSNDSEVPSGDAEEPSSDAEVPSDNAEVPLRDAEVPSDDAEEPSNEAAVSSNAAVEPSSEAEEPSSDEDLPGGASGQAFVGVEKAPRASKLGQSEFAKRWRCGSNPRLRRRTAVQRS